MKMKHRDQHSTVSASSVVMICFALDVAAGKSFELLTTTFAASLVSTDLYVQGVRYRCGSATLCTRRTV